MKIKTRILTGIAAVILGATSVFSVRAVDTELHDAVKEQNFDRVKTLCEEHPEWVNEKDDYNGSTALHYSSNAEIVKRLVESGANVNARNVYGDTPLMGVTVCGGVGWTKGEKGIEEAEYLVEHGADVNAKNLWGETVLTRAVASQGPNWGKVKYLVDNKSDVNVKTYYGTTPLMLAVSLRFLDVVKYLVEHGADPNAQDHVGNTALHFVKSVEIMKYLVEHGADLKLKNNHGKTPFCVVLEKFCEVRIGDVKFDYYKEIIEFLRSNDVQ